MEFLIFASNMTRLPKLGLLLLMHWWISLTVVLFLSLHTRLHWRKLCSLWTQNMWSLRLLKSTLYIVATFIVSWIWLSSFNTTLFWSCTRKPCMISRRRYTIDNSYKAATGWPQPGENNNNGWWDEWKSRKWSISFEGTGKALHCHFSIKANKCFPSQNPSATDHIFLCEPMYLSECKSQTECRTTTSAK